MTIARHNRGAAENLMSVIPRRCLWVSCCILAVPGLLAAQEPPALDAARLQMSKWIETQQLIAKERKDWQHGREILDSRVALLRQEAETLQTRIQEASAAVAAAERQRDELAAENEALKTAGAQLAAAAGTLEGEIRRLFGQLPEPLQAKLQPLYQRMPEDPAAGAVSFPERFQNVLGIMDMVNKADQELAVHYEVRPLAAGRPAEVQTIYVGLAQAYYVSSGGEAGIGRPSAQGWHWEAAPSIARAVWNTLAVLEGQRSPEFIPLPVKLQ